jgi:hypothetical protein
VEALVGLGEADMDSSREGSRFNDSTLMV